MKFGSYQEDGFTLIELMIVIALIAILTTLALPSFQDQVIRTQVQEALEMARFVQSGVQDFYAARKRMPKDNAEAGLPAAEKIIGNYVESMAVRDGVIEIRLGGRINKHALGQTLAIRPAIVEGAPKVPIAWIQGYASVPKGMTVIGDNSTTIHARFLPVDCRY